MWEKLEKMALDAGFTRVAQLNADTLEPLSAVRDMCAANRCNLYERNWTCPPACGSLDDHTQRIQKYQSGIIMQTTRDLEDSFDFEGMQACEKAHKEFFVDLYAQLRHEHKDILALGSGGCHLCADCTYPDAPCRRPQEAFSSMEAYGLMVCDVCEKNGLGYYYGPNTITFTACFLLTLK